MRDIVLTLVVFGMLPFILRNSRLGAYVWAWLSMMNPHKLTFGFANGFPFAYLVALATLVAFPFSRDRRPFPFTAITTTCIALVFWMTVTSFFAINSPDIVWDKWLFFVKIQVMLWITLMLVRGRQPIETLIWVIVLSIGFFGVKGGLFTVLGGGSGRVWGPPAGLIAGNNALGVALVMLLPFAYYLYAVSSRRWIRLALLGGGVSTFFAVLGTQSRGALLAVLAMAFMLSLKGKKPLLTSMLIGTLLLGGIQFMPESWTRRMQTVETYQEDASAMSRIYTWRTLWNLAVDRPLVGGGFGSDNRLVFLRYAPEGEHVGGGSVLVAHSIYFQALGEHGFPGLLLYLSIGAFGWIGAGRLSRKTKNDAEFGSWVPLLMRMIQVSLFGFAVGGAFLSLVYFDLPYYVVGLVTLVGATVAERDRRRAAEPVA